MKSTFIYLLTAITVATVAGGAVAGIYFMARTSSRHDEETWKHWFCPSGYEISFYPAVNCTSHAPPKFTP